MKFDPKKLDNYDQRLDDTIDALAGLLLGKHGIVAVSDGIWDAGPVPGRPQGGPYSTCIFIHAKNPKAIKHLVPNQFNGYRIVLQESGEIIPLGMYRKKV